MRSEKQVKNIVFLMKRMLTNIGLVGEKCVNILFEKLNTYILEYHREMANMHSK